MFLAPRTQSPFYCRSFRRIENTEAKRDHGNPLVKNSIFLCFELWKSCSFNFTLLREELIRLELWLCSKEICVVFLFSSVFHQKLLNFTCSLNGEDRQEFNISVFICVEELPCTEMNKRSHPTWQVLPVSQKYQCCVLLMWNRSIF